MACDGEGVWYPLTPFFSPKSLPEAYLGISVEELQAAQPLKLRTLSLAYALLDYCEAHFPTSCRLVRIDTHNAFHPSAGQQEIVLQLLREEKKVYLRLAVDDYETRLQDFLSIPLEGKGVSVVDLRCLKWLA